MHKPMRTIKKARTGSAGAARVRLGGAGAALPPPDMFLVATNYWGVDDMQGRWGEPAFALASALKDTPHLQRLVQAWERRHSLEGYAAKPWYINVDTAEVMPKDEDARAVLGIKIDDKAIYEELADTVRDHFVERPGAMNFIGAVMFHTSL